MNMMKKNGGFTLVELIVVIAILAILAGVAVPAYSGYITKAKDAAVLSELGAVLTAAQAKAVEAKADSIESIEVTSTAITVTVKTGDTEKDITDLTPFYDGAVCSKLKGTSYEDGASWAPGADWQ